MVGIENTWHDSYELCQSVGVIRQKVLDSQFPCLCVVVPREHIKFPQVWEGKPKSIWGFGDKAGVFVQLDSAGENGTRRIWFLEERKKGLQDGVMLDEKTMCIIDPCFWSEKMAETMAQQEQGNSIELTGGSLDANGAAYKGGGKNRGGKSRGGKNSKASAFGGH